MPKILVHGCFIQQQSLQNRMYLVIIFVSNSNKINECGVLVLSSYYIVIFGLPIFTFGQVRISIHMPFRQVRISVYLPEGHVKWNGNVYP